MAAPTDPLRILLRQVQRAVIALQTRDAEVRLDELDEALLLQLQPGWEGRLSVWEPGQMASRKGWTAWRGVYRHFGSVRVSLHGHLRDATPDEIHDYLAQKGRLVDAPPPPAKPNVLPASNRAAALSPPPVKRGALPASRKPIALRGPATAALALRPWSEDEPEAPARPVLALPAKSGGGA